MVFVSEREGYIGVAAAILAWGSQSVPMRLAKSGGRVVEWDGGGYGAAEQGMHPVIFQLYVSIMVLVLTPIILLWEGPFVFTWWGLLGAALWAPSNVLAVAIVQNVGVSLGSGMWSAAIVVVSFVWGAFGAPVWGGSDCSQQMANPPLAIVGMAMLVFGIGTMSWYAEHEWLTTDGDADDRFQAGARRGSLQKLLGGAKEVAGRSTRRGAAMAMLLGALSGSVMVPLKLAERDGLTGPTYAVSFALAVPCCSLCMALVYVLWAHCNGEQPRLMPRRCFLPFMTGTMWTIGSLGAVYAVSSPLGLTVGYPMTQMSTLIATLWGVGYFREIHGWENVLLFIVASMVSVGGSVLLVIYGTCGDIVPIAP